MVLYAAWWTSTAALDMKQPKADIKMSDFKFIWPCETSQLVELPPVVPWSGCWLRIAGGV